MATIDRESLSVEVREFEPEIGFVCGRGRAGCVSPVDPCGLWALVRGGYLVLEIGYAQAEAVEGMMEAAGFENVEFTPDLQGILRVASAQRP